MRALNALLPPNVYYIEAPFEGRTVRAKYALLTLAQFERLVERHPAVLFLGTLCPADDRALGARAGDAGAAGAGARQAVTTTAWETRPLLAPHATPRALGAGVLEAYRTELRAEAPERGRALYRAFAERYDAITRILFDSERAAGGGASAKRAAGGRTEVAAPPARGQDPLGAAPDQVRLHLRGRRRLSGVEDQAPLRRELRADALAETPPDPRFGHACSGRSIAPAASADPRSRERRGPLPPARAIELRGYAGEPAADFGDLVRGMGRRNAATQQAHAIWRPRRQGEIDVDAMLQQTVPRPKGGLLVWQAYRDDRAPGRADGEPEAVRPSYRAPALAHSRCLSSGSSRIRRNAVRTEAMLEGHDDAVNMYCRQQKRRASNFG